MPFASKAFSAIVCRGLLEALQQPDEAPREFFRLLNESGFAIIIIRETYLFWSVVQTV